jgi:hypothetical protein
MASGEVNGQNLSSVKITSWSRDGKFKGRERLCLWSERQVVADQVRYLV